MAEEAVACPQSPIGNGSRKLVSPGQRYYLDMANGVSWAEPGAGWAGWSGPQETYEFEARAGETARRETERKAQEEDRRLAAKEAALRSAKLDAELKAAREEARV